MDSIFKIDVLGLDQACKGYKNDRQERCENHDVSLLGESAAVDLESGQECFWDLKCSQTMLEAGQSRVVRSVVVVDVVVEVEAETEDGLGLVLFVTGLH